MAFVRLPRMSKRARLDLNSTTGAADVDELQLSFRFLAAHSNPWAAPACPSPLAGTGPESGRSS